MWHGWEATNCGRKAALLRRKFTTLTGRMLDPLSTGQAAVGAIPAFPGAFFALGFGGNGIPLSVIASGILRDLFPGKPNRGAELFSFQR
jgi:glycine/D-amino acid oxidase-like deaminating enzyme